LTTNKKQPAITLFQNN